MSQIHVEAQLHDHVGTVTLVNPGKRNALPQSGWLAMQPRFDQLLDDGARVIVLRGAGDDFCAGADISEFDVVRKNAETARYYEASNVDAFRAVRECPVPTIAAITGYCLGGGFGLAAACDLRLASEDAIFAVPAAKLGLGYPVEAMTDIVGAIGAQNAKRLLYTAKSFSSQDMVSMGFLMDAVPMGDFDQACTRLAQTISELAPLTHRATKAAVAAIASGSAQQAQSLSDATFDSADYAEGRSAFRERRRPQFQGR